MRFAGPIILACLLVMSIPSCWGQQPSSCKVYFKVAESSPQSSGAPAEELSEAQQGWLRDKAPKKYPGVCFDQTKATYVITLKEQLLKIMNSRPHIEPNYATNGGVTGSTITYTNESITRQVTLIFVEKLGPDGKPLDPPLLLDNNPAHTFPASSPNGLELGIKFLAALKK